MSGMAPTCGHRCPTKGGTCFPDPCKLYREPTLVEVARWRLNQCRKAVAEGEEELRRRKEALLQAEIAYAAVNREPADTAPQNPLPGGGKP